MGWSGYGLYNGDGTQSCHIEFIKTAIPTLSEDTISGFLRIRGTRIPDSLIPAFKKGIPSILKKMRKPSLMKWDEYVAFDWQMLLSLFVDNNLKVPHDVLVYGMVSCHYLLGEHSADFNEPGRRRAVIRRFMRKVDSEYCSVRARKEIARILA